MIESFKHKGLKELFETGRSAHVPSNLTKRVMVRLDVLDTAKTIGDINRPGFRLHQLKPTTRWAIDVNGPWRMTFEWALGVVSALDLEQYH